MLIRDSICIGLLNQFYHSIFCSKAQHPVFFLEVKLAGAFSDNQMQNRFDELTLSTIPILHGISALGPHLSFYTYSKEENNVFPPLILQDTNQVNDCAPAVHWDMALMSDHPR
jgi:hypothetical protein